jgi:ubiquinone/menaquinone biosynthesis C-methylase UbiE
MHDQTQLAVQYEDDRNLQIRIRTHRLYTVGPGIEDAVDTALNLRGDESLLDISTGPGHFPGRLRKAGHGGRIVGADFSPGMVEKARAEYPNIEFLQADAQDLPFSDDTFDVVTARHMLYHVPSITKALSEAKRVLKPGGRFMALTNANGMMKEYWVAVREAVGDDPEFAQMLGDRLAPPNDHEHLFRLVEETFGEANLEVVRSTLEFPSIGPVFDWFDSTRTMYPISEKTWQWGRERLEAVLHTYTWPWRVSKGIALITANKPLEQLNRR